MGIFDSAEMKAAKRRYKEEMKLLANIMKPTGKIFMCAKWDDNLRVISIGSMGMSTIVKYGSHYYKIKREREAKGRND